MNIWVFYIFPSVNPKVYVPMAHKFSKSMSDHNMGGVCVMQSLRPDGSNGKDIGAYMKAAKSCEADIMVCLGSHVLVNQDGWLRRIASVWEEHGEGLYGPFGSQEPFPHLRTTCFWCRPSYLSDLFGSVSTDDERYEFERGRYNFTNLCRAARRTVAQVTKSQVIFNPFEPYTDPADSLFLDKYTDMQDAARR